MVTGPCGIGKSWLSCALAQKACRDGYTVHYARVPRLFADLDLAPGDGRFPRLFRMLVKVDLLVLDLCAACSYVEAMSISPLLTASSTASTQHN
ncbi:MAG: ATP-binding protein [Rhodoplanes sp.]